MSPTAELIEVIDETLASLDLTWPTHIEIVRNIAEDMSR